MKFVVIEGLDGSGKSTQLKKLKTFLEEKDIKYKYLHFPRTDSPFFGDLIAKFLRGDLGEIDKVNPYLVAMIYAGDRNDSKEQIEKWLKEDYLVIVDRYVYSNIAFQCAKLNDSKEKEELSEWIKKFEYDYFKIPKPDLNVFLDVPFEFTKQNLESNRAGDDRDYLQGKEDIHEQDLGFQERVRQIYLHEVKKGNELRIINCANELGIVQKPNEIFDKIKNLLKSENIIK